MNEFCDVCDALLTPEEESAGVRWGQSLCDDCNAGYCAANPEFEDRKMTMQPAIHVRDNQDGTMTARQMFVEDSAPFTFRAKHYLTACERYLANRWPDLGFRKSGWSANSVEAIYHFNQES